MTHSITGSQTDSCFRIGLYLVLRMGSPFTSFMLNAGQGCSSGTAFTSQKLFQMKMAASISGSHQPSLLGWDPQSCTPHMAAFPALTRFQPDRLNREEEQLSVTAVVVPAVEHASVSVC